MTALAVLADGRTALIATGGSALYRWDFHQAPIPVTVPSLTGRTIDALVPRFFGEGAYVLSHDDKTWTVLRLTDGAAGLAAGEVLLTSPTPLADLVAPAAAYTSLIDHGESPRIYASRKLADGAWQIVSARDDGHATYELTSPTGAATGVFPALPAPTAETENYVLPIVEAAASARVIGVDGGDGALVWRDAGGKVFRREYDHVWLASEATALDVRQDREATLAPNGWYIASWKPRELGLVWLSPDAAPEPTADELAVSAVAFSPDGRAVLVASGPDLRVAQAPAFAAVRFLSNLAPDAGTLSALRSSGWYAEATTDEQIYYPYHHMRYDECGMAPQTPVHATVDGFLEVLHAGFEAVLVHRERTLSTPRLKVFLGALRDRADAKSLPRVSASAKDALAFLAGDYSSDDGKLVLAEQLATSAQIGEVDFSDFAPRGPYASEDGLKNYFRAFKYTDHLAITDDERAALLGDAALESAWRDWVTVQTPLIGPGRQHGLFDAARTFPPWVREDCVPDRVRALGPKPFPLAWGPDREILESTVERAGVAADCTVPGRALPTGLDLLVGLGDKDAATWQARDPALSAVDAALQARFATVDGTSSVSAEWVALVQLISREDVVPEGVSADVWQRRLAETALASWTSLRHSTVLLDESGSAECADMFEAFEELALEPARGTVDPLPDVWHGIASLLRRLAKEADPKEVADVLSNAATTSDDFGRMAEAQLRGDGLSEGDYAKIRDYAGHIERPYLLLKSVDHDLSGLPVPDPMTKIVDIQHSGDGGPIFHAAVGHPQFIVTLGADRGLLVPSTGAVYSYYEVLADHALDDAAWRKQLPHATRPTWTVLGR